MSLSNSEAKTVLCVCGPTASGKSALALDLANKYDGEIINADSVQIYQELNLLSARPDEEELTRAPHHLYGTLSVADSCDAQRWRDLAEPIIRSCHSRGKLPILVGGTGLYFKGMLEGFSPIPTVPEDIFEQGKSRFDTLGAEAFQQEVATFDPILAARLPATDRQRLVRGWTVFNATGRPLSDWQQEPLTGAPDGMDFKAVVLLPPREALYQRCNLRFEKMLAAGGLQEAEMLLEKGFSQDLPAMRAVGVRDLFPYLLGAASYEDTVALCQQSTRRYAKRQMTWFRNQILSRSEQAGLSGTLVWDQLYLGTDEMRAALWTDVLPWGL